MGDFEPFPKIPRLKNSLMRITEKIDGTNAQILIPEDPEQPKPKKFSEACNQPRLTADFE
jgi:hypothetical protein